LEELFCFLIIQYTIKIVRNIINIKATMIMSRMELDEIEEDESNFESISFRLKE
jgi:hypothetical protein